MCRVVDGPSDGPDMHYLSNRTYMYNRQVHLEIVDQYYHIECWEDGIGWVEFPPLAVVQIEKNCPFRLVKTGGDLYPPIYIERLYAENVLARMK